MKNTGNWIILIILVIFIAGGVILALPRKSQGPDNTNDGAGQTVQNDESLIYRDGASQIGPGSASVKIVVFSDYLCPYCKVLSEQLTTISEKYPNDVIIYHRTFIIHDDAVIMAKAAEAANKQGKFKEANEAIFESFNTGSQSSMDAMAKAIGLNIDQFDKDLNSSDVQNIINKDNSDATALNLGGTPSVYLNGAFVEDPSTLSAQIDSLLK